MVGSGSGDYRGCFAAGTAAVQGRNAGMLSHAGAQMSYQSLDGAWNIDVANGARQGSDGIQAGPNAIACANSDQANAQTVWKEMHWQLTGNGITMGQTYKVSLRINGVVECKTYNGGAGPGKMDRATTPSISANHNLWISGGSDNNDHWNTYAVTVSDAPNSGVRGIGTMQAMAPDAAHTWFFNQCPSGVGEDHFTWRLTNAEQVITVAGGQWINYVEFDSNCRMIVNCGADNAASSCPTDDNLANKVDPAGAVPPAPAALQLSAQPPRNAANARGQWWHIDVTSIQ